MKKLLSIPFVFFIALSCLYAQDVKFKISNTDHGLSNNSVNDFLNDSQGRLWIATWDGISIYNGHRFVVYKHNTHDTTSLGGNRVFELQKDINNTIWALTDNKNVSKYKKGKEFKNFRFKDIPTSLLVSKSGNLLVKTKNDKYFEYAKKVFIEVSSARVKENKKKSIDQILLNKYPKLIITSSLQDKEGNLWYATRSSGLFLISGYDSVISDSELIHYIPDKYDKYSIPSNEIETLFEDFLGNIWLGFKDGGIGLASAELGKIGNISAHPTKYPHLPNETIRAITKDFNNNIWLGYYSKGIFVFNRKNNCFVSYSIKSKDKDWQRVRSLYTTTDKSIWAGTYAGIIRINNNKQTFYTAQNHQNIPQNRNYAFLEDANNLWVACWGGLAKFNFNKNDFISFKGQEQLTKFHIRHIVKSSNNIYLATEKHGVVILDELTGKISFIDKNKGLLNNNCYSLYKDNDTNKLWISCFGGVSIVNLNDYEKSHKHIYLTENNGIPSNLVYSLLAENNRIWISTTKGIAFVNKKNLEVTQYKPSFGWQGAEFAEGAFYKDSRGVIFYGGNNGLNYFLPSHINTTFQWSSTCITANGNTGLIKNTYKNNNIEIHIEQISYQNTSNKKIAYKLENKDTVWTKFKGLPIFYKDLSPGKYIFKVKNSNQAEGGNTAKLSIIIQPAFYQTKSFFIVLLLFLIGLIVLALLFKNKKAVEQQKKLERQVQRRTKIIEEQKHSLSQKNKKISKQKQLLEQAHVRLKDEDIEIDKFRTFVLSEFKKPITQILQSSTCNFEQEGAKKTIVNNAFNLMKTLKEWDYLDHIDAIGSLSISWVNSKDLSKNIMDYCKLNADKCKIKLQYKLEVNDEKIGIDLLRFKLLCKYIIHELFKYASAEDKFYVHYKEQTKMIVLFVSTNSRLLIENIFNIEHYSPYYKAGKTLLKSLNASISWKLNKDLELTLSIPFKDKKQAQYSEELKWNHASMANCLDNSKENLLVLSNKLNALVVYQLLKSDSTHVLIEHSVTGIISALKQLPVSLLLVYDEPISPSLLKIFESELKRQDEVKIPLVYISEQIDLLLKEHLLEIGFDLHVQMPLSKQFLQKQLQKISSYRKEYLKAKHINILFKAGGHSESKPSSINEKLVKKAVSIIETNLADSSFSIEKLQQTLGVSKAKCYRLFKEVLNTSPSGTIISLRLQKASYLMINTSLNISEIAFETGFKDPKYFSKSFKKRYKSTPKTYIEKHRKVSL
ncbi:MAG: two-component regulator propeller domain-containing protein [Tenacibaculum sp.]